MAKPKRAIHYCAAPKLERGVWRSFSACKFVRRWSHIELTEFDVLTSDPALVTCVHCRREH